MAFISCWSQVWRKIRIVRPNFENAPSVRASGSFWSNYLLHKKGDLHILPDKCWELLYAVCEVLFQKFISCHYIVIFHKNIIETWISTELLFLIFRVWNINTHKFSLILPVYALALFEFDMEYYRRIDVFLYILSHCFVGS